MSLHKHQGGFEFKLTHSPSEALYELPVPSTVALAPISIQGFKPRVTTKVGDRVQCGQELAHHKVDPRIKLVSPAGGIVKEVRYGPRRTLVAIVVELDAQNANFDFGKTHESEIDALPKEACRQKLLDMGLWIRMSAFPNKTLAPLSPDIQLSGIYVSTFSTEPYRASSNVILRGNELYAAAGLRVLNRLSSNVKVFSCQDFSNNFSIGNDIHAEQLVVDGYYPSHQAGVQAWKNRESNGDGAILEISLQMLMDIGYAFTNGTINPTRIYAVGGDGVQKGAHFKGRVGMCVGDILAQAAEVNDPTVDNRYVIGGLLTGVKASPEDFVGLNHSAICVMKEDKKRIPFSFFRPGFNKLTNNHTWVSGFLSSVARDATTNNNGEERPCIQCGDCITRCPVGLYPNLLMKASKSQDIESLEKLSLFDCTDCGLCTFVCPSKIELGRSIISGKELIVREG